jgi:hypothetical protein
MDKTLNIDTNSQSKSFVGGSYFENMPPAESPSSIITPVSSVLPNPDFNIELYNKCNHLFGIEYSHLSTILRVYAWTILLLSFVISCYVFFNYLFLSAFPPNAAIPMPLLLSGLLILQGVIIFIFSLLLRFAFKSFSLKLKEAGNFLVDSIIEILKYRPLEKESDF